MMTTDRVHILLVCLIHVFIFGWCYGQHEISSSADNDDGVDSSLKEISFDLGFGPEYFEAYVQPDIQSFTQNKHKEAVTPRMNGLAAKFFNMSPDELVLYWDPYNGNPPSVLNHCRPFHAIGSASFPGHQFFFAQPDYVHGSGDELIRFEVVAGRNNYYYDPFDVPGNSEETEKNLRTLSFGEFEKYERMKRNRQFSAKYREVTGRDYLSMFPRSKPTHHMWRADYFGQEHWATTRETHFNQLPPDEKLSTLDEHGTSRILKNEEPRLLSEYRTGEPLMNMTMKVISCAPRVFEIKDFLSVAEVDHILNLAGAMEMQRSTTSGDTFNKKKGKENNSNTRTSFNTWVPRSQDQVIDSIYRRAADLLRIDEALLRFRNEGEFDGLGTRSSIAESLQLVHYNVGQEYTAHHDFGYARIDNKHQPARYATLLLYLNEGMDGGETEFPRWVNGETDEGLVAVPEKGKAILFYSQLPDGNMDDLSEHAAKPVYKGEKFLINLWVWDPVYES